MASIERAFAHHHLLTARRQRCRPKPSTANLTAATLAEQRLYDCQPTGSALTLWYCRVRG
jgi:hypothetical protein